MENNFIRIYFVGLLFFWSAVNIFQSDAFIVFDNSYKTAKQLTIGGGSSSANVTFETGIGCGNIRMRANHVIQLQSSNFGVSNYYNNDGCTWTFTASECDLSIYCPCFNIPNSFGCLEDYLKISYLKFHDKFCGDNPPVGVYRSNGDSLSVKFRSDYKETGKGFLCFVRCTKVGSADPEVPSNTTCPENAKNPYGHVST